MKKFVIGLVTGVLLATAGTAFGATALIGKKVDSEVQIVLDGKNISNGIVIEGTSYAPVRSLTEAVGLDISYNKGVVSLESETSEYTSAQPEPKPVVDTSSPYWMYDTSEKINERILQVTEGIKYNEAAIAENLRVIAIKDKYYNEYPEIHTRFPAEIEVLKEENKKHETNISNLNKELEALKTKLAELESTK